MTSNIGSQQIAGLQPAGPGGGDYEAMKRQVTEPLRGQFRPEFLNRIDEVIVFHALTDADLAAIVELLAGRPPAADRGQRPGARADPGGDERSSSREGTDPAFGARPLKRTIQRLVENPFARALLSGTFQPGDRVTADADPVSGTLVFSTETSTVVSEAADRRDARSAPEREGAADRRGRAPGPPAFDLPPLDESRTSPTAATWSTRRFRDDRSRCASTRSFAGPAVLPDVAARGPAELMPRARATRAEPRPDRPGTWLPLTTRARPPCWPCVYPDDGGDARIVLTERTDRGGHHSGEVSFPGGRAEPDDADPVATALREAAEEVGLDAVAAGRTGVRRHAGSLDPGQQLRRHAGRRDRRTPPGAGRPADRGRRDPRACRGPRSFPAPGSSRSSAPSATSGSGTRPTPSTGSRSGG